MYLKRQITRLILIVCILSILLGSTCYADSKIIQFTQRNVATFVLYEDGSIASTGSGWKGILGDGTTNSRCVLGPVLINNACKVQAGDAGIALKRDGTVWTWGPNDLGLRGYTTSDYLTPAPIPNMTGVKNIACSQSTAFAIKDDGTVWAWGGNYHGSLGIGELGGVGDIRYTPVQVMGLPTNIVSISASMVNAFALDDQGNVWAWGFNNAGQLGDGTTEDRTTPVRLSIDHVKLISAGGYVTMAVKDDGTVWAWGRNNDDGISGLLGGATSAEYTAVPAKVPGLTDITGITTGYSTMVVKSDGTVWGWGLDFSRAERPKKLDIQDVVAASIDSGNFIVQKRDGSLWAWGRNSEGQLGVGKFDNYEDKDHIGVLTPTKMFPIGATPLPNPVGKPGDYLNVATPVITSDIQANTTVTPSPCVSIAPSAVVTPVNSSSSFNVSTIKNAVNITEEATPVIIPSPSPNASPSSAGQSPGFGFNTLALLGIIFFTTSLLWGFKHWGNR